jgi:hypothetical protein
MMHRRPSGAKKAGRQRRPGRAGAGRRKKNADDLDADPRIYAVPTAKWWSTGDARSRVHPAFTQLASIKLRLGANLDRRTSNELAYPPRRRSASIESFGLFSTRAR